MIKKVIISSLMVFSFASPILAADVVLCNTAQTDCSNNTQNQTTYMDENISCEDLGITRTLKKGSNGYMVEVLQIVLLNTGYFDGEETGTYDTATISAVKAFQSENGLKADGVFGPKSRAAMQDLCNEVGMMS
jgi:murein L,D-transpeptidase YcbB/YkuD